MRDKTFQTKHISDAQVCIATDMFRKKRDEQKGMFEPGVIFGVRKYEGEYDQRVIYDFLHEITGAPINVCYRAMERANKRGLIGYGVSLRTAWLTELGEFTLWVHNMTKANKGFMLDVVYSYWKMLKKENKDGK